MSRCVWSGCEEEADVAAGGREGDEHFTLDLCRRHWAALDEQKEPWHMEEQR